MIWNMVLGQHSSGNEVYGKPRDWKVVRTTMPAADSDTINFSTVTKLPYEYIISAFNLHSLSNKKYIAFIFNTKSIRQVWYVEVAVQNTQICCANLEGLTTSVSSNTGLTVQFPGYIFREECDYYLHYWTGE